MTKHIDAFGHIAHYTVLASKGMTDRQNHSTIVNVDLIYKRNTAEKDTEVNHKMQCKG